MASFASELDTDGAANGPSSDSASFLFPHLPRDSRLQQVEQQEKPRRKIKNPASASTPKVLKSILRHRSDLTPGRPCLKTRKRQTVTFSSASEDKQSETRRWKSSRLRYLSLDLDRWDDLHLIPQTVLQSLNRQKTRQTKRLKRCSSRNILRAAFKAPSLESKTHHQILDFIHTPGYNDTESRCQLMPNPIPDLEYMEKSKYVNRWLRQSSWVESKAHPSLQGHEEMAPPSSLLPVARHSDHLQTERHSVPPSGASSLLSLLGNFHSLTLAFVPTSSSSSRQD